MKVLGRTLVHQKSIISKVPIFIDFLKAKTRCARI